MASCVFLSIISYHGGPSAATATALPWTARGLGWGQRRLSVPGRRFGRKLPAVVCWISRLSPEGDGRCRRRGGCSQRSSVGPQPQPSGAEVGAALPPEAGPWPRSGVRSPAGSPAPGVPPSPGAPFSKVPCGQCRPRDTAPKGALVHTPGGKGTAWANGSPGGRGTRAPKGKLTPTGVSPRGL